MNALFRTYIYPQNVYYVRKNSSYLPKSANQVICNFQIHRTTILIDFKYLSLQTNHTIIKAESNREIIAKNATARQDENDAFRIFLKNRDSSEIDKLVFSINEAVEKEIDCTQCGACCKNLMINVTADESALVSEHLKISESEFRNIYIEEGQTGQMIMNTIPCHFLEGSKCGIYEQRFSECREFPHLNRPNFTDRLFGTLTHYSICPIIYNVIEQLKTELNFRISN